MKAYDSNANPSVEGGITKERDRMIEKERGKHWVVAASNGAREKEKGREKPQ